MSIFRSGENIIVCKDIWRNYGNQKDAVPHDPYAEEDDEDEEDDYDSFGSGFNGIELQLTENDIEWLEEAIKNQELRHQDFSSEVILTHGMKKDVQEDKIQENYYYKQMDLQFIENAKEALKKKYRGVL